METNIQQTRWSFLARAIERIQKAAPCTHAQLHLLPPLHFSHPAPHKRVSQPGLCAVTETRMLKHERVSPSGALLFIPPGTDEQQGRAQWQALDYRWVFLELAGRACESSPPLAEGFHAPASQNPNGSAGCGHTDDAPALDPCLTPHLCLMGKLLPLHPKSPSVHIPTAR